jgi:hypothetical protein
MFQLLMKIVGVVVGDDVAVVAVGVGVLYDDFQRFLVRLHRLNLDYQRFVLVHP